MKEEDFRALECEELSQDQGMEKAMRSRRKDMTEKTEELGCNSNKKKVCYSEKIAHLQIYKNNESQV